MEPQNNLAQPLVTPEPPAPFYKRKKVIIIFLVIFILIITCFSFLLFYSKVNNSREKENASQQKEQSVNTGREWKIDIIYNPAQDTYTLKSATLLNTNTNSIYRVNPTSQYLVYVYDQAGKNIYSSKVYIVTGFKPDNLPYEVDIPQGSNMPIQSSIYIPFFPSASSIKLIKEGDKILEFNLPEEVVSLVQIAQIYGLNEPTKNPAPELIETERSVEGWYLSVRQTCEDGKVYAQYYYEIPEYHGNIQTTDVDGLAECTPLIGRGTVDLSLWDPNTTPASIVLFSGSGNYIAKGNTKYTPDNQIAPKILKEPIGLPKGRLLTAALLPYLEFCPSKYNYSGVTKCGASYSCTYGLTNVRVLQFHTLTEEECPSVNTSPKPTNTSDKQKEFVCEPESACSSGSNSIQICSLVCGYK